MVSSTRNPISTIRTHQKQIARQPWHATTLRPTAERYLLAAGPPRIQSVLRLDDHRAQIISRAQAASTAVLSDAVCVCERVKRSRETISRITFTLHLRINGTELTFTGPCPTFAECAPRCHVMYRRFSYAIRDPTLKYKAVHFPAASAVAETQWIGCDRDLD